MSGYQPPDRRLEMTPEQAALFSDPTRDQIMVLLNERPASIKELAIALDKPKGTVGHHVKALEEAGLIAVVHTRKVRAITEKFYGRLARTYVFPSLGPTEEAREVPFVTEMLSELRPGKEGEVGFFTLRHARLSPEEVEEYALRLNDLAEEFAGAPRSGDTVYGLIIGAYPTDRPSLPEPEEDPQ